jgi:hypothetical protein
MIPSATVGSMLPQRRTADQGEPQKRAAAGTLGVPDNPAASSGQLTL